MATVTVHIVIGVEKESLSGRNFTNPTLKVSGFRPWQTGTQRLEQAGSAFTEGLGCTIDAVEGIKLDMAVVNCDEVIVGKIGAVRPCCFEVLHSTDTGRTNLTVAALDGVENERVRLICGASESLQYACPTHSPSAPHLD